MFLAEFDTAGNFKWVKWAAHGNPILGTNGLKMQIDSKDQIHIAGYGESSP